MAEKRSHSSTFVIKLHKDKDWQKKFAERKQDKQWEKLVKKELSDERRATSSCARTPRGSSRAR